MHSHIVSNYCVKQHQKKILSGLFASPSSNWQVTGQHIQNGNKERNCRKVMLHFMQFSRKPCSFNSSHLLTNTIFSYKITSTAIAVYLQTSSKTLITQHAGKIRCTTTYVQGMFISKLRFPEKIWKHKNIIRFPYGVFHMS